MPQVTIKQQQRGLALKLMFTVVCHENDNQTFKCKPIDVDDLAMACFYLRKVGSHIVCHVSVKKKKTATDCKVRMNIFYNTGVVIQTNCSDDWSKDEPLVRKSPDFDIESTKCAAYCSRSKSYLFTFDVNITVEDVTRVWRKNEGLYDDRECTDLELCSPEGTVSVHRVILATHSQLFRSLLNDQSRKRKFLIQGVSVRTLQHLKNYMYLGTLPVEGLPDLLVLAIHSQMNQLKAECIMKMAAVVSAADLDNVIDFAIQNKIPELIRAMLSVTSDDAVHGSHQIRKNKLSFSTLSLNLNLLALE